MTTPPLRVMQVISNLDIGGAQEVVRTLAENLAGAGCVSVVCTFKDGPLRTEIERLGIPVEILPERRYSVVAFPLFLKEIFQLRQELVRIVRRHQIDVVQTHLLRSMDFLLLSLRLNAGPNVYWTFHNSLFDLREDHLTQYKWLLKPKRMSHHLLYRLGSHWVNGLVAVSEDVKKSILETMNGISADKISVILNCVDVSRYGKDTNRTDLRLSLGFRETDHIMAVVATFKRQKGHSVLIDAAAALIPQFPNLHILLIGDGELREGLQSITRDLNLDRNVHFLGMRNDIPEILAASDSFVLPSLWEGLPMALIEAMASKLPIVATDVSGSRQVMVPEETGILVAPGDPQELTRAIAELLTNPVRAHAMGTSARRRVENLFSAQKQAREYVSLFELAQGSTTLRLASTGGEHL
jgi:glycosyltransferase involved in cell wall biosynthesis